MWKKKAAPDQEPFLPQKSKQEWVTNALAFAAGAAAGSLGLMVAGRKIAGSMIRRATKILMTDEYSENLLELYSASMRAGLLNIGEANLRSSTGTTILRPLGSPKKVPDFSGLMFDFAQLATLPTQMHVPIAMETVIGPKAKKPLRIDIPIIIAGMGYGWALSEKAKVALALGASAVGTATNTGMGPWLESERKAADKLIFQYNRGDWSKRPEVYQASDAIEIQLGQGAAASSGMQIMPDHLDPRLRQRFELGPSEALVNHARQPGMHRPEDLAPLVQMLREQSGGVPIGVKLAAGQQLEKDLHVAVQAGVDFISLDGCNAATKGSPPILQDDFGLPTLYALVRASRWFEQQRLKGKVTLIVSGGLKTPGDYLKALALGADVVAIGTMALFAITHTQVTHAIPYEPPTQAVWYKGKAIQLYDPTMGGCALAKYLQSCTEEMAFAVRVLGLTSIQEVDKRCLFALDPATAEICDVPLGYETPKN
ncbi:MAG: FMN-binding glutamate synthase family protein [Firmicutes bacterium]|nr:FMN-binding glutamate synthase family protein [Bacillota bacterium]